MAKAPQQVPGLSGEQIAELLGLLKGADTVELKLTVPESDHRSAAASLRLDVMDAQIRQVVFFDTPDLTLNQSGLVVRARRVQGKGDDSVVKLRPVVPNDLPPRLRKSPSFGVEVDAMPGGFVCSGSLKAQWGPRPVREVLAGDRPIRKLFTKEQREFFADVRAGGPGPRRPHRPGPDQRPQVEVRSEGTAAPDGGGTVVLPGRVAHPRALDEVPTRRSLPGLRRVKGVSLRARGETHRSATDQDAHGARVLPGISRKIRVALALRRPAHALDRSVVPPGPPRPRSRRRRRDDLR